MQASYKSWESKPVKPRGSDSSFLLTPPLNPKAYQPLQQTNPYEHHRWSSASSNTYYNRIENDAVDTYLADRRRSSASVYAFSEKNMHGGLGRFALITTIIGISWSTIRAGALLAILIQIMRDERHTYPGVISIVIMFTSVQTYLGSRAMPRILYLIIVVDLLAIYTSIVLAVISFLEGKKTGYQQFGVSGGNCPCMLGFHTGHDMKSCAAFQNPTTVGCNTNYSWANNTDPVTHAVNTYPKSCLLSGDDKDLNPNLMTYMVLAEIVVGGVGLLYGLIVLGFASRWIRRAVASPGQLFDAFTLGPDTLSPADRKSGHHKMPGRAIGMTVLAFIALLMFAAVTIIVHVLDETRPIRVFYKDSFGPLVSGVSVGGNIPATGVSWSDCFVVDTPYSADGGFRMWWDVRQSRILRALALA